MTTLVVVGDSMLDRDIEGSVERLCPDAPVPVVDADRERNRPGGAALAAVLLAGWGDDVVLVTGLGRDPAGRELRGLLESAGVDLVDLGMDGPTPEKVRVRAAGQSLLRLDRGGPPASVGPLADRGRAALDAAAGILVADYGRGLSGRPDLRECLSGLRRTPTVWDPHPRGSPPVPGVTLATPNASEAATACPGVDERGLAGHVARANALVSRWQAGAVALTMGRLGALLARPGAAPLVVPTPRHVDGDTCGAGDCFAGAAMRAVAQGAVVSEAVESAVAEATAFVASGGASRLRSPGTIEPQPAASGRRRPDAPGPTTAAEVVAGVRRRGGTVVASGGCFDLLHAGHVATLRAARRLGDCLVVCLNGDDSVRRLKGPERPLQPAADRAELLSALECVDAVEVFDHPTPTALLERLRPDLFVKGGDYASIEMPEAATLARWGGQVVVVPYLTGRSSTRIIKEARHVPS